MSSQAVLFTLLKDNQILLEERHFERLGQTHLVFPGGHVEEGETPEGALEREVTEELGIKILDFRKLDAEILYPHKPDLKLTAFLITSWEGQLPEKILDQDNPIIWVPMEEALASPLERIRLLAKAVKSLN